MWRTSRKEKSRKQNLHYTIRCVSTCCMSGCVCVRLIVCIIHFTNNWINYLQYQHPVYPSFWSLMIWIFHKFKFLDFPSPNNDVWSYKKMSNNEHSLSFDLKSEQQIVCKKCVRKFIQSPKKNVLLRNAPDCRNHRACNILQTTHVMLFIQLQQLIWSLGMHLHITPVTSLDRIVWCKIFFFKPSVHSFLYRWSEASQHGFVYQEILHIADHTAQIHPLRSETWWTCK